MAKKRKRRVSLGLSTEKHRGLVGSFARESVRQATRAARMSSCRLALFHFGHASRLMGAAIAHAESLQEAASAEERKLLDAADMKVKDARDVIARKCNTA